jgi:hypothetical protein
VKGTILRDESGFLRFGWFMATIALATLLVLTGIFYGPVRWGCRNTAEAMGREWRWSPTTLCLVKSDNGRFVPLDNLRITNVESS